MNVAWHAGWMLVEIYSDVVCPWCYIGKRRFEEAMAQYPRRDEVTVVWKPFQLDPTARSTATPVAEAYAKKFGGVEQAQRIIATVTDTAASVGLEFHMDRALRANTLDAHRLIAFAHEVGGSTLQGAMKERLLLAYFTEGANVADHTELTALAAEVGMDRSRVMELLAGDEGLSEVRAEIAEAAERDITAVPTFVFDGKWSVPGAQEPDTFLRVLNKLMPDIDESLVCEDIVCEVAQPAIADAG